MTYLDASVIVPFYLPEPISPQVDLIIPNLADPLITNLTEVEVTSAISRKVRGGEIRQDDGELALQEFMDHVRRGLYRRLVLRDDHFEQARRMVKGVRLPLKTLDSLHLAVCVLGGYDLVTADSQLARGARALGINVQMVS